jgi:hypothetical protein
MSDRRSDSRFLKSCSLNDGTAVKKNGSDEKECKGVNGLTDGIVGRWPRVTPAVALSLRTRQSMLVSLALD